MTKGAFLRAALALAIGTGVGVLMFLSYHPDPGPVRTPVFALLAYLWAHVGMGMADKIPTKRRGKDFDWE